MGKKCCICGHEFEGWGNNPTGAMIESNGTLLAPTFADDAECCKRCNNMYVIPGRLTKAFTAVDECKMSQTKEIPVAGGFDLFPVFMLGYENDIKVVSSRTEGNTEYVVLEYPEGCKYMIEDIFVIDDNDPDAYHTSDIFKEDK